MSHTTAEGPPAQPRHRTFLRALRQLLRGKRRGRQRSSWRCREEQEIGGAASQQPPLHESGECECVASGSLVPDEAAVLQQEPQEQPQLEVVTEGGEETTVSEGQAPPAEALLLRPRGAVQQQHEPECEQQQQQQQQDKMKDHLSEAADDPQNLQALPWDIEAKDSPARRCDQDAKASEASETEGEVGQPPLPPPPEPNKTTRCFAVDGKQRRVLHRCCVLVEQRFNVHVVPPRRYEAEACGTVTGAPEDVANALALLRKQLCIDMQPTAPETPAAAKDAKRDAKAGKTKAAGKGAASKGAERKASTGKDGASSKGRGASRYRHK